MPEHTFLPGDNSLPDEELDGVFGGTGISNVDNHGNTLNFLNNFNNVSSVYIWVASTSYQCYTCVNSTKPAYVSNGNVLYNNTTYGITNAMGYKFTKVS